MTDKIITPWEFPEELRKLQDTPSVAEWRSDEEIVLAAITKEMERQHEAIQFLLEQWLLGAVHKGRQARVEVSESGG